jgi:hypothetical protein
LTRIILIILNNFKINYIINIYNNRNRGGIRNNLTNLFNLIFLNTLIVYKQIFYTSPILLLVLFFKFTLITLLHNICGVHESIKYILLFSDIVGTLAKGPSINPFPRPSLLPLCKLCTLLGMNLYFLLFKVSQHKVSILHWNELVPRHRQHSNDQQSKLAI